MFHNACINHSMLAFKILKTIHYLLSFKFTKPVSQYNKKNEGRKAAFEELMWKYITSGVERMLE